MYEFCFSLSTHLRALGTAMLAKKPIIAIAISNSTMVNPFSIFFYKSFSKDSFVNY